MNTSLFHKHNRFKNLPSTGNTVLWLQFWEEEKSLVRLYVCVRQPQQFLADFVWVCMRVSVAAVCFCSVFALIATPRFRLFRQAQKKKNKTLALPLTHMAALYSLCLYVCMQQQGHGHGKERFCCTPRCSIASVYACEQLSIGNKLVKCTTLWFTTGGKTQFCIQAAFRLLPAGVCVPLCLNALITTAKRRKGHFFPA